MISENEWKTISRMYGLIVESSDEDILNYVDKYIESHGCDEIANDMEKIKNTTTYTNLEQEDKENFDSAIYGLKHPGQACIKLGLEYNPVDKKSYHCKTLKKYMKQKFRDELPNRRDLIISQICAFSYLWTTENPPKVCNQQKSPSLINQNTQVQNSQQQQPSQSQNQNIQSGGQNNVFPRIPGQTGAKRELLIRF